MSKKLIGKEDKVAYPDLSPGSYLVLSVSDTGCGIEEENLVRIFEPYFSTKSKEDGTGLGLSVVHGIVKSHEGAILVHSRPGEGTVFEVLLPLAESEDAEPEERKPVQVHTGNECILFVDDEHGLAESGRQMLERSDYDVVEACEGGEGLSVVLGRHIDLAIVDLIMPEKEGVETIMEVRQNFPNMKIIAFAGGGRMWPEGYLQAVRVAERMRYAAG